MSFRNFFLVMSIGAALVAIGLSLGAWAALR
jgi:high-affinity Fe2+/Pb2+ permease